MLPRIIYCFPPSDGKIIGEASPNHMKPLNLGLEVKTKGTSRFKACGRLAYEKFFADGGDLEVRNAGGLQE